MPDPPSENPDKNLTVENEFHSVLASKRGGRGGTASRGKAPKKSVSGKMAAGFSPASEAGIFIGENDNRRIKRSRKTVPENNAGDRSGAIKSGSNESPFGTNKQPNNSMRPPSSSNCEDSNQQQHPRFISPFLNKLMSAVPSSMIDSYSKMPNTNLTLGNATNVVVAPKTGGDNVCKEEAWNDLVNEICEGSKRLLSKIEYKKLFNMFTQRYGGLSVDEYWRFLRVLNARIEDLDKRIEAIKMNKRVRGLERLLENGGLKDLSEKDKKVVKYWVIAFKALKERIEGADIFGKRKFGACVNLEEDSEDNVSKKLQKLSIPRAKTMLHKLESEIKIFWDKLNDNDGLSLTLGR